MQCYEIMYIIIIIYIMLESMCFSSEFMKHNVIFDLVQTTYICWYNWVDLFRNSDHIFDMSSFTYAFQAMLAFFTATH